MHTPHRLGPWPLAAMLAALAISCTAEGDLGGSTDAGIAGDEADADLTTPVALSVTPSSATITIVDGAITTTEFTLTATYADGTTEDATDRAAWSFTHGAVGTVGRGLFTPSGTRGGLGTITATVRGLSATATMTVQVESTTLADGVPATAPDWFANATAAAALAPQLLYPSSGSYFPPNLGRFDVHWSAPAEANLFELTLSSPYARVVLYTADRTATLEVATWFLLADSSRGQPFSLELRAMNSAAPTLASSATTIAGTVASEEIRGGLYYWASSGTNEGSMGIYRHDMSEPGEQAEPYYIRQETGRCVGCHSLSRDGQYLMASDNTNRAEVLEVATQTPVLTAEAYWYFAAFLPGNQQLIAQSDNDLNIVDATTGVTQATVATGGPAAFVDLAPDSSAITYVRPLDLDQTGTSYFYVADLITQSYDAQSGTFGTANIIAQSSQNQYYPAFSPDSQWVLFNRATGHWDDNASAELYVVPADGSTEAIRLELPNGAINHSNSWPKWAPFEQLLTHPDGTSEPIYWFTFSSKRAFGTQLPAGQPQIWMAPFFPERARRKEQSSAPAFRLPFQHIDTNNHIAQWTTQVVSVQ